MSDATNQHPGIFAFVYDGSSGGIVNFTIDGHHLPMVCLGENAALLPKMIEAAQLAASTTGKTVRMLRFSRPEELKVFAP